MIRRDIGYSNDIRYQPYFLCTPVSAMVAKATDYLDYYYQQNNTRGRSKLETKVMPRKPRVASGFSSKPRWVNQISAVCFGAGEHCFYFDFTCYVLLHRVPILLAEAAAEPCAFSWGQEKFGINLHHTPGGGHKTQNGTAPHGENAGWSLGYREHDGCGRERLARQNTPLRL